MQSPGREKKRQGEESKDCVRQLPAGIPLLLVKSIGLCESRKEGEARCFH